MRPTLIAALLAAGCATTADTAVTARTAPRVRPGENPHARAGFPKEVSPHAEPSDDGGYVGYRVGGGAAFGHGDGPAADDGTWGWDYVGFHLPSWVTLGWWRDRYQGGQGAYKTDGPRPLERRHE